MIDAGDSWRPGPIYEKGYGVTLKLAALDQIIGRWIPDTPYLKMPRGHTLKKLLISFQLNHNLYPHLVCSVNKLFYSPLKSGWRTDCR